MASNSNDRAYEDFVPKHEMSREPATHILSIDLSDEGKQWTKHTNHTHAHVSFVSFLDGAMVVRGERPAAGDRWRRFRLELRVPDGCDAKAIHARFENGVVRVTMPGVAPEPVQVETKQQDPSPTTPKPASPSSSSAQDQKDGGRAAPAGEGEGEGDKQKDEVAAQKQETVRQRVSSAKDGSGRDDGTGTGGVGEVTTAASSPRHGYGFGFVPGRKMMVTTVLGVVFVLVTLGIYVRYSVSP